MDFEHLRALLDLIPLGIFAVDSSSRVVYKNRAAARLGDSILELPIADLLKGEALDEVRVVIDPPGLSLSVTGRASRSAGGDIDGAIVVFEEVTARKRAEDELKNTQLFLESIIEHMPNMVFVKDAKELRFERFNRAGEELLGLSRSALLGKNDYDLFPRAQADHFQARDRETLRAGAMLDIPEEPIDTAAGRRWLHTKKVPIVDRHGTPLYLLGISEDITERKVAQDQGLLQQQKLEAVGSLAGGVAHDFNNMLSVILSCAELIELDAPEDASFRGDLAQIIAAGRRAAALTAKLLAFSRRQVLKPRVLDLCEVMTGLEEMLRRLIGEDVELELHGAQKICNVLADPGQIEQVIVNLAVNARDAMPNGGKLTITVAPIELDDAEATQTIDLVAGDFVELSVRDTGTGMSRETLSRIFEPFFTTKPLGKGTGLGLPTVFGIVKQSGGEVRVESELGKGSIFRILLPSATEPAAAHFQADRTLRGGGAETILLVEDEDLVRSTALRVLKMRGYDVLEAAGPREALEIARAHPHPIQLLLTDVVMPVMNGRELAELVRALRPRVRVLFMSGYTDDVIVRSGVQTAEVAFLPKPFTIDELAAAVRQVLDAPRTA